MLLHAFVWYYTQKVSKKDCKKSCADQRLTYLHLTLANKSHLFFFLSSPLCYCYSGQLFHFAPTSTAIIIFKFSF